MVPTATPVPERERTVRVEETGRITPRMVLDAYEATGLIPKRMIFRIGDGGCAIGALAAIEGANSDFTSYAIRLDMKRGAGYATGFYQGFDGTSLSSSENESTTYRRGYHDGRRVARFVFPNGGGV